jgi:hypothetical protein
MCLIDFLEEFVPFGESEFLQPSPASVEARELWRNLAPEFHDLSPG